ncbi:MAG: hypothetical protein GXP27_04680 [Planctomycetes bacterium]|nr:hypothetical protein [Planctomycetota bacterium]
MMVSAGCPNCGEPHDVGDEGLGSRPRCRRCGAALTLSASTDDAGAPTIDGGAGGEPPDRAASEGADAGRRSERSRGGGREQMPKKLGHYVIQRKLGAGAAMGVVYLGRDPVLEREVAIKVLPAGWAGDKERLRRFLREAKSAARLNHPNVADVYQVCRLPNRPAGP